MPPEESASATATAPDQPVAVVAPSQPPSQPAPVSIPSTSDTPPADQPAEPDPYEHVAELDADELIKRNPRLTKRLGALVDKQSRQRLEVERARLEEEQQARTRSYKENLYQRAQQGDAQAELELLDLTKQELSTSYGQRAVADQLKQAEDQAKARIWQAHAASFGLDPDDEEVAEAVRAAADFKALNTTVLKLAKDPDTLEAMWLHPAIQKRYQAALDKAVKEAKSAGFTGGQASMGATAPRPDLGGSSGSGGSLEDELAVARRLQANPHDAEALELWGKRYRKR